MPNTETAGAGAKPERTPQDYAIEHAEYMAKKAERLLDAINHLNAQRDEGGDAIDSDALTHAEEAVTEAFGAVRNDIYEFRKRRDRAAAQPAGEYPAPHYPSIEDLCARIKAADDAAADRDYMLDSNDCIAVLRGEWTAPLAMDKPERASHGQAPAGESLRTDALCDLSYSHGLKAGWNYCASDDLAGFERAQKIGAEALRTLKSPTAQAAPAAVAGPNVTDAMALAFHSALSDGAIGSDEVEDIKTGLSAALAAAPATQPAPPLPERDASVPAERQGLFRKFDVRRVDGTDKPGGKHHGCTYFVLDVDHDPCARPALAAYAAACEATHPALAADLLTKWGAAPTTQPEPQPSPAAQGDALDAERYRWLRRPHLAAGHGSISVVLDDRANGHMSRTIWLDRLDAAIDAARAAQEGKSHG